MAKKLNKTLNFSCAPDSFGSQPIWLLVTILAIVISLPMQAQFTMGGNASNLGSGCYRLTSASNSQAGYVYFNAALNLHESFDYRYNVYLGTNNAGADGICFVLRGTLGNPYIGTGGGGIGFLNLSGGSVGGTIGVEVDTYQNGNYGDPTYDHIGIVSQASPDHTAATALTGIVQASTTNANVEDGNFHTLNIRWDAAQELLQVYFDCDYRLQYQGDIINDIFNGDSLVHWGFVGSTGGANNDQRFCYSEPIDSLFTPLDSFTICKGDTVQLNAGTSALTYAWTPSSGLSSATIGNPYAYPLTTTNYIVTATYMCDTIIDSAYVDVIQPDFNTSTSVVEPLCNGDCDGQINLTVTGNSDYAYIWNTNATTEDLANVCEGTYFVTVQDTATQSPTYLCYVTDTVEVEEPTLVVASVSNATPVSCNEAAFCDASAMGNASGGVAPYAYHWSSSENTQQASQLCAGTNTVTVTDAHGCDTLATVIIGVPDVIVTDAFQDTLICISNPAALAASSVGGTSPYSYTWTIDSLYGDTFSYNVATVVYPRVTKKYFVSSTDSKGCAGDTATVLVKVRLPLDAFVPETDTICPYNTTDLFVTGFGGDSLYSYTWSSGAFGPTTTVGPDLSQWFYVTVTDFCGTPPFVDSVYVQVGGYSRIAANLRAEDDSICVGENIYLIASAKGGFHGPEEYIWSWSEIGWTNNPLQFDAPLVTRTYAVTVTDKCLSPAGSDTLTVYVGNPEEPRFSADPAQACAEASASFKLLNFNPQYTYNWTMGDGLYVMNSQQEKISHTYDLPGCYDVNVEAITDFGCIAEHTEICAIQVLELPEASFRNEPNHPNTLNPIVYFYDQSNASENIRWWVNDVYLSEAQIWNYEFTDTGTYEITLVAQSANGCTATTIAMLNHTAAQTIYFPNSFTPNGDGKNEEFGVFGENIPMDGFEFSVYDRWGERVFYSRNPAFKWNGKILNNLEAPMGTYAYTLKYQELDGTPKRISGQVTLSKSGQPNRLR